jgi:hypothetical protein
VRFPRLPLPSAATAIALLALAISAAQCAISFPLVAQYYIHPELVVTSVSPRKEGKLIHPASYAVSNDGNAAATGIEHGKPAAAATSS